MFQKAKDNQWYKLNQAVKITKNDDYKVTFDVPILINEDYTYVHKHFDELEIPDFIKQVDERLWINFNKILKISEYSDYMYLTSDTKKTIGKYYINYNIKVSNQNEKIKKLIEGDTMNKWIKLENNFININNVTNVVFFDDKVIFNFINSASNNKNVEDIRPDYEIEYLTEEQLNNLKNKLINLGLFELENRLINLDNVYNIKTFEKTNTIFINFTSNIVKKINGKKVISTEFVKYIAKDRNEFNNILKKLGI